MQTDTGSKDHKISRKITILISGDTEGDVEDAFNGAVDGLNNGQAKGKEDGETYSFSFINEPLNETEADRPRGG